MLLGYWPWRARLDGFLVDIRGENLDAEVLFAPGDLLIQHHRDAVGLFAGGAAGHPDPNEGIRRLLADERSDHLFLELLERLAVPEEIRHGDQHLLGQGFDFLRVLLEEPDVLIEVSIWWMASRRAILRWMVLRL